LTADKLNAILSISSTNGRKCLACDRPAVPLDYVCLSHSALKVRSERRFWQAVHEKEVSE